MLGSLATALVVVAGPVTVFVLTLWGWLALRLPPRGSGSRLWVALVVAAALAIVEGFLWAAFLFGAAMDGNRRPRIVFLLRHLLLAIHAVIAVVYIPLVALAALVVPRTRRTEWQAPPSRPRSSL